MLVKDAPGIILQALGHSHLDMEAILRNNVNRWNIYTITKQNISKWCAYFVFLLNIQTRIYDHKLLYNLLCTFSSHSDILIKFWFNLEFEQIYISWSNCALYLQIGKSFSSTLSKRFQVLIFLHTCNLWKSLQHHYQPLRSLQAGDSALLGLPSIRSSTLVASNWSNHTGSS